MDLKNIAWQEKYRPTKLDGIISDSVDKIKVYLSNPSSIPNLLLISKSPGTGKTTTAKAIISELGCDSLVLNSSDERGIDTVRDSIKDFAKTISTNGMRKCVFLDESDGLTKPAQESLRNLMETYANNVFFILTCNDVDKIIEPLQSRCISIRFNSPDKLKIREYLMSIVEHEHMQYTTDALDKLIDMQYPSIRNCINYLQDLKAQNKDATMSNIIYIDNDFDTLWEKIKLVKYSEVREYILLNGTDVFELNNFFFNKMIEESTNIDIVKQIKITSCLADNEKFMKTAANPHIIFLDNLAKIALIFK